MKPITLVIYVVKQYINKLRDHCHETVNYRGPAGKICNLRNKQQNLFL